jgi:peptidoglycan/xylan/chitin deacetylase (PgdA/CDA1 family)
MAYRWLFPEALFRVETNRKEVYLTFDDGPHPEATPFVLDVLRAHGIKATFFVLGKNALAYPELLERMKREGHVIGNHGMDHLNGWTTGLDQYLEDQRAGKHVVNSSIFRPAYGKMSLSQYKELSKTDQIVFWDVISGDFDTEIDGDRVKRNVIDNVRSGSVIVFHDSKKAFPNIKSSLNDIIGQLGENGYSFGTLTSR